jgi:hypothetical protein
MLTLEGTNMISCLCISYVPLLEMAHAQATGLSFRLVHAVMKTCPLFLRYEVQAVFHNLPSAVM